MLPRTRAPRAHRITLRAQGVKSNRFGLGDCAVEAGDRIQVGEISNVASYLSANDVACTSAWAQQRSYGGSRSLAGHFKAGAHGRSPPDPDRQEP